jgi:hypothetical protein
MTSETDPDALAERVAHLERVLAQRERARPDWDSYAAVIASLVGLLALLVAAYTAHLQRKQVRASVWPRMELGGSNMDRKLYAYNPGVGPARITGVKVQVGGKTVRTWDEVVQAFGHKGQHFVYSAISDRVLPAGLRLEIFAAAKDDGSRAMFDDFLRNDQGFAITLCYCSTLDDCWLTGRGRLGDGFQADRPIDHCPIEASESFRN